MGIAPGRHSNTFSWVESARACGTCRVFRHLAACLSAKHSALLMQAALSQVIGWLQTVPPISSKHTHIHRYLRYTYIYVDILPDRVPHLQSSLCR